MHQTRCSIALNDIAKLPRLIPEHGPYLAGERIAFRLDHMGCNRPYALDGRQLASMIMCHGEHT